MKMYLVSTEDNDFVGITPDLLTAKKLAREEMDCRYDRSDISWESEWDSLSLQKYWVGDVADSILPIILITEVPFFKAGTRFPVEFDDITTDEEIPNFLRRQAE
jgi:hypothetical protein